MDQENLCMGCMEDIRSLAGKCPECGFDENIAPDSPMHLTPRTILEEKYILGRVLGQGGFGITYLAWDLNLNIKLAIKEYFPQDLATRATGHTQVSAYSGSLGSQYEHGLDKYLQEARTLGQLEGHPNIVSVRDFFKANGTAYIVMSYVDGITLKDHLANSGGIFTVELAREIVMPVIDALKEIHDVGILHRDISPDNIFLNQKGQVVLIDFGAARQAASEKGHSFSIILKPGYAPEEQYRRKGVQGPWTDIYAVAATFYHLITGVQPPEALERMVEDTIISPREFGAALSETEEKALMKALAIKASERYQSITDFQNALMNRQVEELENVSIPREKLVDTKNDYSDSKKKTPSRFIIGTALFTVFAVTVIGIWSTELLSSNNVAVTELTDNNDIEFIEEQRLKDEDEIVNLKGNTAGNIVNGGIASIQGDWVYFRSNEGGSLYRGHLGGGESRIISADAAWFINVVGNWIYYSNRDDNERIYKIKTDGSNRTALTDGAAWFVTVHDDKIYYIKEEDDYRIYIMNTDGNNNTRITEDSAWFISIEDDWVYYINYSQDNRIYRVKMDGSENEAVSDYAACCVNVQDGWVYHVNEEDGSKFYKIRTDGTEVTALTEDPAWFINVSDEWLYYVNQEDNFSLNKIKNDGSGRVKLTNESARYINIIDQWLFYLNYEEADLINKVKKDGTGQSLVESGL